TRSPRWPIASGARPIRPSRAVCSSSSADSWKGGPDRCRRRGTPMRAGRGGATRRAPYATLQGDREDILRRYLPLVRRVVQRLAVRKPSHIELDDLVSWGIVGLLDAIEKYDPKKEALFSTYAQFRIRGAILDHLRSLDWVPRSVRQKAALIEKVSHE